MVPLRGFPGVGILDGGSLEGLHEGSLCGYYGGVSCLGSSLKGDPWSRVTGATPLEGLPRRKYTGIGPLEGVPCCGILEVVS
jgi:hypothetical protein